MSSLMYVVVDVGVAVTELPEFEDKVDDGDHV
jgi:hypothetical protein